MSNELYFLPLLIDALQHPNQKETLLKSIQQINELREQDGFQEGFSQFEAFMNQSESFAIEEMLVEIDKKFDFAYDSDNTITLILTCDDQPIGSFNVELQSRKTAFDRIQPGIYQLRTETGWVIWEERLNEDDLLWSLAFPNQPLMLAADSDESQQTESKTFHLLDNTLEISIYPGPEFGSLTIQYNARGTGE